MSQKNDNPEKEYYRTYIIGNCGYPVHIIESADPISFDGEMVIWKDFHDLNMKAYRLRPGELVEVFTFDTSMISKPGFLVKDPVWGVF